jgi:hypothetical protein
MQFERALDVVCAAGTRARQTPDAVPPDRRTELQDLLQDRPGPTTTPARAAGLLAAVVTGLRG